MLMLTLTTALCIQLGTIDPLPGTIERAEPVSMTSPDSITSGNLIADLNGDGVVDFLDVSIFIQCLNTGAACADLNGDGVVDFFDVQLFIAA